MVSNGAVLGVAILIVGTAATVFPLNIPLWYQSSTILVGPYPVQAWSPIPQFPAFIPADTIVSITIVHGAINSGTFGISDIYVYNSSGYQTYQNKRLEGCAGVCYSFLDLKAAINKTETFDITQGGTYYFAFNGYSSSYISGSQVQPAAFVIMGQTRQYLGLDTFKLVGVALIAVGAVLGVVFATSSRKRNRYVARR